MRLYVWHDLDWCLGARAGRSVVAMAGGLVRGGLSSSFGTFATPTLPGILPTRTLTTYRQDTEAFGENLI